MLTKYARHVPKKPLIAAVVIFAAVAGALIFVLSGIRLGNPLSDLASVAPGYIGESSFGDWRLICEPAAESPIAPETFDAPDAGPAPEMADSACRVRFEAFAPQEAKGETNAEEPEPGVILVVNLSRVGPARSPALMLRLPPTLKEGDTVTIRGRGEFSLEILARNCSAEECVAAGTLSETDWNRLTGETGLQAVFPLDETQRVAVDISTEGLRDALTALDATQPPAL
jgi:invasion protein IalB